MRNSGPSSLELIGESLGKEKKSKWLVRFIMGYVIFSLVTHLLPVAYWIADIKWIFYVMNFTPISGLIADWRSWNDETKETSFRMSDCSKGKKK